MTVEDALRKIELLRRINTDTGAAAAEVKTAYRLEKALMERYAIKPQDIPDVSPTKRVFRLNWSYWLEEFGLSLGRLGNRSSAAVGNHARASCSRPE